MWISFAWLAVAAVSPAYAADELPASDRHGRDVLAVASDFARAVFAGDADSIRAMAAERLADVLAGEDGQKIRDGLTRQVGAVTGWKSPWLEDENQDLRRFRVPVIFEHGAFDARIVIDTHKQVVGFFVVPPKAESAANAGRAQEGSEPVAHAHGEHPGHAPAESAAESGEGPRQAPPAGVREIDLQVGAGDSGLPARLSLPPGQGPFPAAIVVHDAGALNMDGSGSIFRSLAWGLAARGIAVLRYDKRSFARPFELSRHGDALTVDHMITEDAVAAVALLRSQQQVDPERVFVIGHGLGGKLAPRIASRVTSPLAGTVVLAAPVRSRPELLFAQARRTANSDGAISAEEQAGLDQIEHAIGSWRKLMADPGAQAPSILMFGEHYNYWKNLHGYHPPAVAAGLGTPILIVHGGRDLQVASEDYDLWRAGLREQQGACFTSFDQLGHLLRAATDASASEDGQQAIPIANDLITTLARWLAEGACASA